MAPGNTGGTRLVADIGGTNTRLAIYDESIGALRARRQFTNAEHASLEEIINTWLGSLDETAPAQCCLAVAAPPPFDEQVAMLNIDWRFSPHALAQRFGFHHVSCVNDFEANAYALPHLDANDISTLHTGERLPGSKLATIGPGTGLGGSTLDTRGSVPVACACEPGHMGLAPATERELSLFQWLQARHGEIYAELLLSGPGLKRLYLALAAIRGEDPQDLTPEDISTRAITHACDLCVDTLHTFCALLGSVCGDFALANGAYGGVYVAGGIVPDMVDFLRTSSFAQRFREKGNMGEHLSRVPLHVITGDNTGLLGAAHAPLGAPVQAAETRK